MRVNGRFLIGNFLGSAKTFLLLLRDAYREFQLNDPLRMAAATSFFASFALPPIMIILIGTFGLVEDPRSIRHALFEHLRVTVDRNVELQTREIVRKVHYLPLNGGMKIAGFIFLLFVATTLFAVVQRSMNQLWKIKVKDHQGFGLMLLDRAKSIGIIMVAGLLFSTVLLGEAGGWLLLPVTGWFILILKFLSDGRPAWKTAVAGGIFTGVLFTLGEIVLHLLFSYKKAAIIYGGSTSLVLLLLFVFYCSFIFYYGACFTAVLAVRTNRPILPARHALRYTLNSVEETG